MRLINALGVRRGDIVALVGAGGKTSAMFVLGEEACALGLRVVLTTTTRIYCPPAREGQPVILRAGPELVRQVGKALEESLVVVAGAGIDGENKIIGVDRDLAGSFPEAGADLVAIEADGSAGRPFKAPQAWEPVIPQQTTLVVPVVGIDCLGKPLSGEYIHRPEMVASLTGLKSGQAVTPEVVAGVLGHRRGYRKGIPPGCHWVPLINKVETEDDLKQARKLAGLLGRAGAGRVVMAAVRDFDPVKEVLVF